ncbi:MAG: efflux RND transporter periplasmic adaptor subunit [Acidobacteria bacterium]|nr:efflux RND transporter periplasmic adaptor subunit [Acidobacteriota bacterium]
MSRKRRFVHLAVVAAIIAIITVGALALQNKLAADRAGRWIEAAEDDLVIGVDVTGVLESTSSARFGPPKLENYWNFKISMMAPEGSDAKPGQPLLGFDTTELQDTLQRLQAEADSAGKQIEKTRADLVLRREDNELKLAEAQANLRKAEMKLEAPEDLTGVRERQEIVLEHELASKEVRYLQQRNEALDRAAGAEIRALETKRKRALDRVNEIQKGIAEMTVRAPRSGTVVYTSDRRGQKKKIGDTVWRMEQVIELPDLTSMRAVGEVDEAESGRIAVGQRVELVLDAHPDEEFGAIITSISNTVRTSDTSPLKVLPVVLELEQSDPEIMKPGMRFRGTIEMDRIEKTLVVPLEAVQFGPEGAFVLRRGLLETERVPVDLGRRSATEIEVVSGISSGDLILIEEQDAEDARS